MVFSSLSFIFIFLLGTVLLYFVLPGRVLKNAVLLLASLLFYAWGEPRLVVIMVLVAFAAYAGGLAIDRFRGTRPGLLIYVLTIVLITGNLFVFKYLNFAADTLGSLGLSIEIGTIRLPIGISFYTFQILSYVIDLKRGSVKLQKSFFNLLLYLCFFPQLIAGPIVRYSTVETEITKRRENQEESIIGIKRFIIGLAKKAILSNGIAKLSVIVYAGDPQVYGSFMYWMAAIAFSFQIYFDFSGYSDMAIGLGLIFGFHFPENFTHPYNTTSVTEFWRCWHTSLSGWFRDYVYIPLGGNRCSKARHILNLFIVWGLTGLWHGASWNFVVWGLYYCAVLVLEKYLLSGLLGRLPSFAGWLYTAFVVVVGWVIFNITDFAQLGEALRMMFSFVRTDWIEMYSANTGIAQTALYLLPCLVCSFPVGAWTGRLENSSLGLILSNTWYLLLLFASIASVMSSSYNPFIYFRF